MSVAGHAALIKPALVCSAVNSVDKDSAARVACRPHYSRSSVGITDFRRVIHDPGESFIARTAYVKEHARRKPLFSSLNNMPSHFIIRKYHGLPSARASHAGVTQAYKSDARARHQQNGAWRQINVAVNWL